MIKITRHALSILFLAGLLKLPAIAQNDSKLQNHSSRHPVEANVKHLDLHRSPIDNPRALDCDFPANPNYCVLSILNKHSTDHSSIQKTKLNPVPMIVFGVTGAFLGAWVGHSIDAKENTPGEFSEIFTTGTVIGMGTGLVAGGIIGYYLGRDKRKEIRPN